MRASVLPGTSRRSPKDELWTAERCYILETWNHPEDPDVSLARARVEPGVATAFHALDVNERYVIVSGEGRVEVEGLEPASVQAGDVVVIPAGTIQRIENVGSEDLVFLCICTPRFEPRHYHERETS